MQNVKPAKPLIATGSNQQTFLFIIIGAAVALVVIFILISSANSRSSFDAAFFADIPHERLADGGFILGDPEASFTLVEFADWYCPHCQTYKPTVDQFIRDYVATGKARYEYRVLMTMGASSQPNTEQLYHTLECIETAKPGSFFHANDVAYELIMSGVRGADVSLGLAERLEVDYAAMLRCTQDTADQFNIDQQLAGNLGVSSTPAVLYRLNGSQPMPVADRSSSGLAALVESMSGQ